MGKCDMDIVCLVPVFRHLLVQLRGKVVSF